MATRRRILSILAGCAATSALASSPFVWRGRAMGAEARILLSGTQPQHSYRVFSRIETIIGNVERQFSLHMESDLARLNANGLLRHPTQDMLELIELSDAMHKATGGAFDPTIQPLWLALARCESTTAAQALIGWNKVSFSRDGIALSPGAQLTFNGIAQGFCADKIAAYLRSQGYDNVLVDSGELLAIGPQADGTHWPVVVAGEDGTVIGQKAIENRALATSSPLGMRLAKGEAHIISPRGSLPRWNTVCVSAPSGAIADALSTACCLLDRGGIEHALAQFPDARLEAIV